MEIPAQILTHSAIIMAAILLTSSIYAFYTQYAYFVRISLIDNLGVKIESTILKTAMDAVDLYNKGVKKEIVWRRIYLGSNVYVKIFYKDENALLLVRIENFEQTFVLPTTLDYNNQKIVIKYAVTEYTILEDSGYIIEIASFVSKTNDKVVVYIGFKG